jgi:zinc protease
MKIILMEDHELPLVSGIALYPTGSRLEPAEKVGLAALTGIVMRSGGTTHHADDDLNQQLEDRAAAVETGINTTAGYAQFSALSEDLPEVLALFADVIKHPAFAQTQLDLAKSQQKGLIARRNDDASTIAQRELLKLIYGQQSPYAREPEYKTLDPITRSDLLAFYRTSVQPQGMLLGILGDIDPVATRSLIASEFGEWQPKGPKPAQLTATLTDLTQATVGGIYWVDQPQLSQSTVLLGHLGGTLDSPDYAALRVMNGVLNGFGGRLFNQIRSKQGLAYSVYASWDANFDYPGLFIAGGQTRSTATVSLIQALRSEIDRIRTSAITPAELAYAKDSALNGFVFNFQDAGQTLWRLLRYDYFDYPSDFIFRFQQEIEATTIEDVQRVAQTYLKPEDLVTVVVGNAAAIQPPLTQLGSNLIKLDIAIPES